MIKSDRIILVTGATGHQGGAVVRHLAQHGWKLRALTRDATKPAAKELEAMGVEVFEGDPMDLSSLERAMEGVYGVFAMTTPFEVGTEAETAQGVNLADAAMAAGVEHFVFSSVAGADRNTGIPHFESKYRVEEHISYLGLRATVVRPVYFMDNFWYPSMREGVLQGTLSYPMKADKPLQMIAVLRRQGLRPSGEVHRQIPGPGGGRAHHGPGRGHPWQGTGLPCRLQGTSR